MHTFYENNYIFGHLDFLPSIPQHFIDEAIKVAYNEEASVPETGELREVLAPKIWFREVKDLDGKLVKGRPNIRFNLSKEFNDWVSENICASNNGVFVNINFQNKEQDGTTTPLHTDVSRDYLLIYLIKTSNPDQYTRFWQENGHPVVRERSVFLNDFSDSKMIAEGCYETGKWYLMRSAVLHSQHNIQGHDRDARLGIHVNIKGDPLSPGFFSQPIV